MNSVSSLKRCSLIALIAGMTGLQDTYDHIDVKIVGWAVIDKNCLIDFHDDEIVYTDTKHYDSQYDTSNGFYT